MVRTQADTFVEGILYSDDKYDWDFERLIQEVNTFAGRELVRSEHITDGEDKERIKENIADQFVVYIESLRSQGNADEFSDFERRLTLQSIDELWMQHIDAMAHLREEVAFEGYAQKNPLVVYKERAFDKFIALISEIGFKVTKGLFTASVGQKIEQVEVDEAALQALLDVPEAELKNLNLNNLLSDAMAEKFAASAKDSEGVRVYQASPKTTPTSNLQYK